MDETGGDFRIELHGTVEVGKTFFRIIELGVGYSAQEVCPGILGARFERSAGISDDMPVLSSFEALMRPEEIVRGSPGWQSGCKKNCSRQGKEGLEFLGCSFRSSNHVLIMILA